MLTASLNSKRYDEGTGLTASVAPKMISRSKGSSQLDAPVTLFNQRVADLNFAKESLFGNTAAISAVLSKKTGLQDQATILNEKLEFLSDFQTKTTVAKVSNIGTDLGSVIAAGIESASVVEGGDSKISRHQTHNTESVGKAEVEQAVVQILSAKTFKESYESPVANKVLEDVSNKGGGFQKEMEIINEQLTKTLKMVKDMDMTLAALQPKANTDSAIVDKNETLVRESEKGINIARTKTDNESPMQRKAGIDFPA